MKMFLCSSVLFSSVAVEDHFIPGWSFLLLRCPDVLNVGNNLPLCVCVCVSPL